MKSGILDYRRDIDGLRGFAVAAVLLFHAGIKWFTGGYVGVDIFFVISGYLITSIILKHLVSRGFSFGQFYYARAKRLLPALFLVLISVSILSLFVLLPDELEAFGHNLIESLFFSLNFFLWRSVGYFDLAVDQRPLLHLWSLSIEEQFYLCWPFMIWALYGVRKSALPMITFGLMALSLAISQWAAIEAPGAAFYFPLSRGWEFMMGAQVAQMPQNLFSLKTKQILGICGLGMLLLPVIYFDDATTFPGLNAVIPCLGASLVIVTGYDRRTIAFRVLGTPLLVWLGLISYSLYLWHWPLFSLARDAWGHQLSALAVALLAAVSVGLAYLSWRYCEIPFRRGRFGNISSKKSLVVGGGLLAFGAAIVLSGGVPERLSPAAVATLDRALSRPSTEALCNADEHATEMPPANGCVFGKANANVEINAILWGDSHASVLQPALANSPLTSDIAIRQISRSACPPLLGVRATVPLTRNDVDECIEFNNQVMKQITNTPGLRLVIMSARWSLYNLRPEPGFIAPRDQVFQYALARTVREITSRNIPVLLIGGVPELEFEPARCLARHKLLIPLNNGECLLVSKQTATAGIVGTDETIMLVASRLANVEAVFPTAIFCKNEYCITGEKARIFYWDDNHLSADGAMELRSAITAAGEALLNTAATSKMRTQ